MIKSLKNIDQELFLYFNSLHNPFMDDVMWYVSTAWPWLPLFAFVIYYAHKHYSWKGVAVLIGGAALCILLADRISVLAFKDVFQRYRPTHHTQIGEVVHTVLKPNGEEYRGGLYGFVSSHAANYGAIATYLFLLFRKFTKWWWLLFLWAALIAYSRVYLGVHYPADIFCGGLLGFSIALVVHQGAKRLLTEKE